MSIKLLILFIVTSISVFSQIEIERDVLATSGSEISNSNITISFTFGETFTNTLKNNDMTVTQGFQQFYIDPNTSVTTYTEESISIFPSPASQQITFESSLDEEFSFYIYDITGKLIQSGSHNNNVLLIDIKEFADGKYIFEYLLNSGQRQTLPFLKIK